MAQFAAVQPDTDDVFPEGQGLFQGGEGILFAEVTEEAEDQIGAEAKLPSALGQGFRKAPDDGSHGYAPSCVGLGIKEDLGAHHAVPGRPLQVGPGHVEEVLFLDQDAGPGVVDVQEALEVLKGVCGSQGLYAGIGQGHPVATGQLEDQLRLEGALDVDVEFRLGHAPEELREGRGRDGVEVDGRHGLTHGHSLQHVEFQARVSR